MNSWGGGGYISDYVSLEGSGGMPPPPPPPEMFWYFRALRQLMVQSAARILIELLNF